jgi:hypothetical protein
MWLFLNQAMLSIVADKDPRRADRLLVRARVPGDIERGVSRCGGRDDATVVNINPNRSLIIRRPNKVIIKLRR